MQASIVNSDQLRTPTPLLSSFRQCREPRPAHQFQAPVRQVVEVATGIDRPKAATIKRIASAPAAAASEDLVLIKNEILPQHWQINRGLSRS